MRTNVFAVLARTRIVTDRFLAKIGIKDQGFLVILSVVIGLITGAAAVFFHELIDLIRTLLYEDVGPHRHLYSTGIWLLVVIPALGGLLVGIISNHLLKVREGKGIVDVLEQVSRSSGKIDPLVVLEKIFTSAITIGTGGSAGAEGPIVQIGAGIASGIGQLFRVARQEMTVLIGVGSAAGISAIFNSPIGGVFFAVEVVLRDYSIRAFTPVIIASVVANYATAAIFQTLPKHYGGTDYTAIFNIPASAQATGFALSNIGLFAILGIVCGLIGVMMTKLMHFAEEYFEHIRKIPRFVRPAIGGALLGVLGILYIFCCGKVIDTQAYQMPAFFGDGYGAVQQLFLPSFYSASHGLWINIFLVLCVLVLAKIIGTCFTLGSGGSGGVIAPSLFLGGVLGGAVGMVLAKLDITSLQPQAYALVGMGAVLAAVIHAPLTSILILLDVTRDYTITMPAMIACIIATATARVIFRDSLYTMSLRQRGVHIGTSGDLHLLQSLYVEQVALEPAVTLSDSDPLQKAVDLITTSNTVDFVVVDKDGSYVGMLLSEDIKTALIDREALPLLLVGEIMRTDVPVIKVSDDLATALDTFSVHDIARLPVVISGESEKIVGVLSRAALMRRYYAAVAEG
jgi:CIC family chloride channel protein